MKLNLLQTLRATASGSRALVVFPNRAELRESLEQYNTYPARERYGIETRSLHRAEEIRDPVRKAVLLLRTERQLKIANRAPHEEGVAFAALHPAVTPKDVPQLRVPFQGTIVHADSLDPESLL